MECFKGYEEEGIEGQNAFKARSFLRAVKALDVYPDAIQTVNDAKAVSNGGRAGWRVYRHCCRLTASARELHEG